MNTRQLETLAKQYIADNAQLTLQDKLLLSHFVCQLKQHTQDVVRPNGAPITDNGRGLTLVEGG